MTSKLIRAVVMIGALLGPALAANAADLRARPLPYKPAPVVPLYGWSGFYFGINGGWGWGDSPWDAPPAFGMRGSGALAGLTYGYNFQSGAMVFGIEGDIDWSDISGSTACGAGTCSFRNRWLGTLRGRIGPGFDRVLPYVTGGLAYGGVRASNSLFTTADTTAIGWTAGAGVEFALANAWTAKIEYLYVDLGRFDCGVACGLGLPENVGFTANVVRVGLNYRFNGGGLGGPLVTRY